MKKCIFLTMFCLIATGVFAQSPLEVGRFQLNAGIGTSNWGTPVYVGLDYGACKDITVGGELSYRSDSNYYGATKYRSSVVGIGVNGNYHFNRILQMSKKWNLYAGLGLNYFAWSYENNNYKSNNDSNIGLGAQLGARYFFTSKFGVNFELGGGNATNGAKFGITYKL
jgi:outer membrane immunogenic protein